jgi:Rha family phage regulatory protein
LDVARHFEKQHKDVLRSIGNITADLPAEFGERNFTPTSYQTGQGKTHPAYNLTRDGFSLLAMGFTGAKAMKWKVRYIQAFNAMEEKLTQPAASSLEQDMQRKLDDLPRMVEDAVARVVSENLALAPPMLSELVTKRRDVRLFVKTCCVTAPDAQGYPAMILKSERSPASTTSGPD